MVVPSFLGGVLVEMRPCIPELIAGFSDDELKAIYRYLIRSSYYDYEANRRMKLHGWKVSREMSNRMNAVNLLASELYLNVPALREEENNKGV